MQVAASEIRWRPVAAATAVATLFTVMQGLSYPLLAVTLDRGGSKEAFIGVNTAMIPVGMMLAAPVATSVMHRVGSVRLAGISVLCSVVSLVLIGAIGNPWLWLPLRLLTGASLACLFVVSDTWVIELAAERVRGRVLGFYSLLQSVGFAVGPALLLLVGTQGWAPFLTGAACGMGALLPLLANRADLPILHARHEEGARIIHFPRTAPLLLAGIAATALADQVAMSLLPIYTLHQGYDVNASYVTLVAMTVGTIALQLPIGWLADHMSRRFLYILCALWTAVAALLMPITVHLPLGFWLLVATWGGAYFAIYTLSLVRLGERFKGSALATGNAAFAAMWGLGGLVGTPLTGAAMQLCGPAGFPGTIAVLFGLLAVALMSSSRW